MSPSSTSASLHHPSAKPPRGTRMPATDRQTRVAFALAVAASLAAAPALAQEAGDEDEAGLPNRGGKLLLTGGVSQVEGAGGGGLTPWATIAGQGTRDQVGAGVFYTRLGLQDYSLGVVGANVGLYDRVEFSVARQRFDTERVGAALGLGRGFTFEQDVIGVKVRLFGDAVLEQDRWLPQVAIGAQHKRNDQGAVLAAIGARDDSDTDVYLSATKLFLDQSLLLSGTARYTRANQAGILGFGGDLNDDREWMAEASAAVLLRRDLAVGVEYRQKPDNLGIAGEDDWMDAFIAWQPSRDVSLTLAWVELGNIVIADGQRGLYLSVQAGF